MQLKPGSQYDAGAASVKRHPDACDAMLARASQYCEPGLMTNEVNGT